jgi:hypothetical protein
MSKALIEKAFKKYCETTKLKVNPVCDRASRCELCKSSWLASATWQREQLEAEILNKEKSWYAEFPDEKSAQEVFNIIKELQTENKTIREQLEAEIKALKEQVTDLTNGNYKKGIHTMEQLHRIVEDRNKTIDWWTNKGFEDLDKIKDLQAENKTIREQLIKELREWIESNKELRGYTGIPDDTLNIILAKLDLLEKGGE